MFIDAGPDSYGFFLFQKSDLPLVFKDFLNEIELFFDSKVCVFRSYGGWEFTSKQFVIHQFSCPYTPEQNGMSERKHRHLLDMTRTLLADSGLPSKFWVDTILTAVFLINQLPFAKLNNIPPIKSCTTQN